MAPVSLRLIKGTYYYVKIIYSLPLYPILISNFEH